MQRINTDDGLFVEGNEATNTVGTALTKAWCDSVQEEIAGVIEMAGEELDSENQQQLAGIVTPITQTGDPSFSDDSRRPASTGWIRRAMGAIATAAGFAVLLAANGYIKFPSWLGSWIVQWGEVNTNGAGDSAVIFPIAFPKAVYAITLGADRVNGNGVFATTQTLLQTGVGIGTWTSTSTRAGATARYIVLGA